MCLFVGYQYERGGYRVWDPKRQVVDMAEALFSVEGSWQKYVEAPLSIFFIAFRSVSIGARWRLKGHGRVEDEKWLSPLTQAGWANSDMCNILIYTPQILRQ